MKTQTTTSQMYCSSAAMRYAQVLYELNVPKEAIQKAREIFEEVPQLHDVFVNPTIPAQKKERVIDKVFPQEMRNFLKVACKYERMDLIPEIFAAYDRYCDEQDRILSAVLTCVELPSDEQLKNMEAFLCKKYEASKARIESQTDSTLLGGFVLRTGSDEYDWSLKGRLDRLGQKLTWR